MPAQRRRSRQPKAERPEVLLPGQARLDLPLTISWKEAFELPVAAVNVFSAGFATGPDARPAEVVLNFGFMPPVPVYGTPDQQKAQAEAMREVQVQPVARFTLSTARIEELHTLLVEVLKVVRPHT